MQDLPGNASVHGQLLSVGAEPNMRACRFARKPAIQQPLPDPKPSPDSGNQAGSAAAMDAGGDVQSAAGNTGSASDASMLPGHDRQAVSAAQGGLHAVPAEATAVQDASPAVETGSSPDTRMQEQSEKPSAP